MYNYEIKDNQVLVTKEKRKVSHATLIIEDDTVLINNIFIDREEVTSPITFLATLCSKTKELVIQQGVNVSKVLCGDLIEVAEYDEFLSTLDVSGRQKEPITTRNMR